VAEVITLFTYIYLFFFFLALLILLFATRIVYFFLRYFFCKNKYLINSQESLLCTKVILFFFVPEWQEGKKIKYRWRHYRIKKKKKINILIKNIIIKFLNGLSSFILKG